MALLDQINEAMNSSVDEESKISELEIKTAKELFGDKANNPDALMINIKCENGATTVVSLPKVLEYTDGEFKRKEGVTDVEFTRTFINKKLKFRNFMKQYGSLPAVGLPVKTYLDPETNFMRVEVRN